jgi:hypothetical protein
LTSELDPERESLKVEWFERIRKSERQLDRVLGNTTSTSWICWRPWMPISDAATSSRGC